VWRSPPPPLVVLDAATGKILWQTAAPESSEYITDGFVSSANGVVYAGSSGGTFEAAPVMEDPQEPALAVSHARRHQPAAAI
jgi:outer membrane protein assembly factor BamB